MSLVPLPSSTDLDAFANPAEHIIALVEPATLLLQEATTVDIADENMSKAKALETWVRANRLGEEAVGAAQTIKLRAAMQVGRLTPKQPTDPRSKGLIREPEEVPPPRRSEFRTLYEHEDEVESYIADRAPRGRATQSGALEAIRRPHVQHNSGENEWYTPLPFIKAANATMGGIDLDPCSSVKANEVVGAELFYSIEDDGLTQPWNGRVWMNPPYGQPFVGQFCQRLAERVVSNDVSAAVALVNNATETGWFQDLADVARAMCFPRGRIRFWHPERDSVQGLQGQVLLYFGNDVEAFRREFDAFGVTVVR